MPIVIWFPGCVERACTAVKPATSPPRQISGPTKQGMQHTQRTRPDMGGCRERSKHHRECSVNRISAAPSSWCTSTPGTERIVRAQPSAFLTNCLNKPGLALILFCLYFALLSFIGPAWRCNVHLYCLLATSMPRSIRCMHRKSKRIPFVCLLLPTAVRASRAWLSFSLCCICCTGNIHMVSVVAQLSSFMILQCSWVFSKKIFTWWMLLLRSLIDKRNKICSFHVR